MGNTLSARDSPSTQASKWAQPLHWKTAFTRLEDPKPYFVFVKNSLYNRIWIPLNWFQRSTLVGKSFISNSRRTENRSPQVLTVVPATQLLWWAELLGESAFFHEPQNHKTKIKAQRPYSVSLLQAPRTSHWQMAPFGSKHGKEATIWSPGI